MENQIYMGIDNGLNGGLTVIENGNILAKTVMPIINSTKTKREYDIQEIVKFISDWPVGVVIQEKASAMPKQGVCSMFSFGRGYGIIRAGTSPGTGTG